MTQLSQSSRSNYWSNMINCHLSWAHMEPSPGSPLSRDGRQVGLEKHPKNQLHIKKISLDTLIDLKMKINTRKDKFVKSSKLGKQSSCRRVKVKPYSYPQVDYKHNKVLPKTPFVIILVCHCQNLDAMISKLIQGWNSPKCLRILLC